jgi:hypothetical protein
MFLSQIFYSSMSKFNRIVAKGGVEIPAVQLTFIGEIENNWTKKLWVTPGNRTFNPAFRLWMTLWRLYLLSALVCPFFAPSSGGSLSQIRCAPEAAAPTPDEISKKR